MDDDARAADPVRTTEDGADTRPTGADPAPARTGRRWPRRLAIGLALVLAAVAIGFQVQVAEVQDQVDRAETAQLQAELDQETARLRLESVGDRVEVAQTEETDAQGVLARSRDAMAAQGLQEELLGDVQVQTAHDVRVVRSQNRAVEKEIAAQQRLQPVAGACLFDLLRGLSRTGSSPDSGTRSDACTSVTNAVPVAK